MNQNWENLMNLCELSTLGINTKPYTWCSYVFHYRLHCSCFILFPSVNFLLLMFHLISVSPHFTDHVSSHFLQSTLHWSCFTFISFSPQSISFISPTTVHLVHIYLIWLCSYYIIIQPYCQCHFSANPASGN